MLEDEAKNILLGQELKTKTSSFAIGFNAPKDPQTKIETSVYFGGHDFVHKHNILRAKYNNAINQEKEMKRFIENNYNSKKYDFVYHEMKFKV